MCSTDFASLSHTANVHRPAEQVFALEEDEMWRRRCSLWWTDSSGNIGRAAEPPLSPELQQMFTLARRMGYEIRPIARRLDAPRQTPGPQTSPNWGYRAPFRPRDYSKTKCFSCGPVGDTRRFAAPSQTHLYHSDRTGGMTGRTDHSDTTADPHRETKYRPGPNPHWPVCHQFGPRFITNRHPRSSPGIYHLPPHTAGDQPLI